jgi:hypothetical protein
VGGAEVDADRQPVLVGRGTFAGFGDLQQGHGYYSGNPQPFS